MSQIPDIAQLLNDYAPLLARVAITYEADPGLREDLIQNMSLAVWRALVARIAHNRAVDHVLKETRRQDRHHLNQPLDNLSSATNSHKHDSAIDLLTGLRKLSIAYRQVMALQLEGFSQSEIGLALGLSEANVAQRARRARLQLEQILNRR